MADKKQYTYLNNTDQEQVVVGVGVVPAGESITVDEPFSNPNFEQVESKSQARRVAAVKADGKDKNSNQDEEQ